MVVVLVSVPSRSYDEVSDDTLYQIIWNVNYPLTINTPIEKGYGNALKKAMLSRPNYDVYVNWDNDLATPATEIPKFIEKVLEGYDVVVGRRMGRLDNPRQMMRGIFSRTMNTVIGKVFATGLHEHFSGFRAYSHRFVEEALPEMSEPHWMFQPESIIVAQALGFRVIEIPVPYDNTIRPTKLSRLPKDLSDILPGFWRLLREWK